MRCPLPFWRTIQVFGTAGAPGAAGVPEPASIAIWSLIGLALTGFGYYRVRRNKWRFNLSDNHPRFLGL